MSKRQEQQADVTISNEGSIFTFVPLTDRALAWIEENVYTEPWQWFGAGAAVGSALCVEHRYARELAQGMLAEGLRVI